MIWNWQQNKWPQFEHERELFSEYESEFLHNAGTLLGSMKHISDADQESLKINLIRDEAFKTSEIEGEFLDRDSLQSSIRKHFGLKTDQIRIPPAEQGIGEMMVDLYKTFHRPLDHSQLFAWHKMLTYGRRDLTDIGIYRTHEDPMQVVSGSLQNPTIHFEAPPSRQMKKEMNQFVLWFNQDVTSVRPGALVRSGIAHLYFEGIHPFEDGNGRIGRAISEKMLSQSLKRPTLIAISTTIESEKKKYYDALQRNSHDLEINNWLLYFCDMVIRAQHYTQNMIDFLIEKGKFYHRFESSLNERQSKVVERIFREGVGGFDGGLSADNYISITRTTPSTATRDLQKLVEMGAFAKAGERKGTRYFLKFGD